ncbi:MAG: S8 family serine peptidase [Oligoflexia bacterium]|nr:S8 family serine peptidase [Oligoflexia bacterium]
MLLTIVISSLAVLAGYHSVNIYRQHNSVSVLKLAKPEAARMLPAEFPSRTGRTPSKEYNPVNDPFYKRNWGIKAVNAEQAWLMAKGGKRVTVAVIDTGADIKHEDLASNIWKNPGETGLDRHGKSRENNGIDDDGNGFIDDVYGWNFAGNNNDLTDNHGHGTHIAGIIGAVSGNKKGIAGVASNVSIMVLKNYDPRSGSEYDPFRALIASIRYAINNGADIINYSGGGPGFSSEEYSLLKKAEEKGILVITAAGNEANNTDDVSYYPSCYRLPNMISVASVNKSGKLIKESNYGRRTVDIAAPGDNIYSTLPGNRYGYLTGTSQATAFVTGAVSVLISKNVSTDFRKLKKVIVSGVSANTGLAGKLASGGILDVASSLLPVTAGVDNTAGKNRGKLASRIAFKK